MNPPDTWRLLLNEEEIQTVVHRVATEISRKFKDTPIVELMINHGANYWSGGLDVACEEGHMNIVELFMSKTESYSDSDIEDFYGIERCNYCQKRIRDH